MNDRTGEAADTKTRILDAAEKLFGMSGFKSTSLRDITAEAGVNLAAVNYHFQSKDSLIDAVAARLIEPLNRERLELLDATGPEPSVEQILTAFLRPVFRLPVERLAPLMGRVFTDPQLFANRIFKPHFAEVGKRFSQALGKALPELSPQDVVWRLHFSVGAMSHTMLLGPVLPQMTGGLCDTNDHEALVRRAVEFLAAGFRATASNSVKANESKYA